MGTVARNGRAADSSAIPAKMSSANAGGAHLFRSAFNFAPTGMGRMLHMSAIQYCLVQPAPFAWQLDGLTDP
jgi:hypothetical protein